ncbi:MAG: hypothetical protein KIT16_08590 [Rhodospirillaceae bacterium]|nr:hypothetical protein [Rhodospirillaceae bacterium]
MKIRNLVLAGSIAIAAALSSGAAGAAQGSALPLSIGNSPAVEQAYFGGYPGYGYGYGHRRLCHVPFFKLVRWFGFYRARMIKARCSYGPYYY